MGKITKQQLSESLLEFISSNKGTIIVPPPTTTPPSNSEGGGNTNTAPAPNVNYQIPDGSITESKLHDNIKDKLAEIAKLKTAVRLKKDLITEQDLEQNLKNKINNSAPKTWADLMGIRN